MESQGIAGRSDILHTRKPQDLKVSWHQAYSQATREIAGCAESHNTGRTQSHQGQVWSGKDSLWFKPDQSPIDRNKRIDDFLYSTSAQLGQISRGGRIIFFCEICITFFSKLP
jgi:hypothetical protein